MLAAFYFMRVSYLFLLLFVALFSVHTAPAKTSDPEDWTKLSENKTLTIYARTKGKSTVRELKAVGVVEAPAWVVKNVLDDMENYENFMPYTAESKVMRRDGNVLIGYQRLATPFVADRDYTIRVVTESKPHASGGLAYLSRWVAANDLGPAEKKGIVRVKINEGSWRWEPLDGEQRTLVTYSIYTDPGGGIPRFIVNAANSQAIPKVFEALRKTVKDPKYSKK